jgi:hypothetical protein
MPVRLICENFLYLRAELRRCVIKRSRATDSLEKEPLALEQLPAKLAVAQMSFQRGSLKAP